MGWVRRLVGVLVGAAGACASSYVAAADREGTAIQAEKAGVVETFRARGLVDPGRPPAARAKEAPPVEVPAVLTVANAVKIATAHNRDYQTRREAFFLTALNLGLVRRDFTRFVFDGTLSYDATDVRHANLTDVSALAVSGTRILPWGGTLTVGSDGALSHDAGTGGRDQNSTVSGSVSITQPLLRGAGREVTLAPLTQAERDAVYAARDFELFRQRFAVTILQDYYGLVSQKKGLANRRANVLNQERAWKQAQALFLQRRGTQVDVFRAEQSFLRAQNGLLDQEQGYRLALDRFKIQLGLPTDVEFDVGDEFPAYREIDFDAAAAVGASLHNRLDLLTSRDRVEDAARAARVARNELLPDLDLDASYSIGSDPSGSFRSLSFPDDTVAFGVTLGIPLDRKAARNAHRASLIGLEQAKRALRQTEDSVVVEVRDALRGVRRQKSEIELERRRIESLKRSVRRATLENVFLEASNRDVVEALEQLTEAENGLLDLYVAYEIARLTLLQQLGVLFVDKEGAIAQ
ncbi:MAG: TolC family protein [Planctomycetota bacterium]